MRKLASLRRVLCTMPISKRGNWPRSRFSDFLPCTEGSAKYACARFSNRIMRHAKTSCEPGHTSVYSRNLHWRMVWQRKVADNLREQSLESCNFFAQLEKGKNPLLTTSYRGISLTSVIGKLFEYIILQRMTPILSERNIPHYT